MGSYDLFAIFKINFKIRVKRNLKVKSFGE